MIYGVRPASESSATPWISRENLGVCRESSSEPCSGPRETDRAGSHAAMMALRVTTPHTLSKGHSACGSNSRDSSRHAPQEHDTRLAMRGRSAPR